MKKTRVAIIPFETDDNNNCNCYRDVVTVELHRNLSKSDSLFNIAIESSTIASKQHKSIIEIATLLSTDFIISGTLSRNDDRIRLQVKIIHGKNGHSVELCDKNSPITELFEVISEVSQSIIQKLLNHTEAVSPGISRCSKSVLELYLKAKNQLLQWNSSEVERTKALLHKVILLDPEFLTAYIDLCNLNIWQCALKQISPVEAEKNVNHSLALLKVKQPNIAEYYSLLASREFWISWNIKRALRSCNKALKLHSNNYDSLLLKGLIFASKGDAQRALEYLKMAKMTNPLSDNINYTIAVIYNYIDQPRKALSYLEENRIISQAWTFSYHEKLIALCKLRFFDDANMLIEESIQHPSVTTPVSLMTAYLWASQNREKPALEQIQIFEELVANDTSGELRSYLPYLADIFLLLQDKKRAFSYLEQAITHRSSSVLFLKINTLWKPLQNDPRYESIIEKLDYFSQGTSTKYEKSRMDSKSAESLLQSVIEVIKEKKLWLFPELTQKDLAKEVQMSPHMLSHLLNEYKQENFFDFINSYRLEYFIDISKDSKYQGLSIQGKALEAGFRSKTTFNSFFKRKMGMTPTEYFNSH